MRWLKGRVLKGAGSICSAGLDYSSTSGNVCIPALSSAPAVQFPSQIYLPRLDLPGFSLPGSTIITNCWPSDENISKGDFFHPWGDVWHRMNDPTSIACTQVWSRGPSRPIKPGWTTVGGLRGAGRWLRYRQCCGT